LVVGKINKIHPFSLCIGRLTHINHFLSTLLSIRVPFFPWVYRQVMIKSQQNTPEGIRTDITATPVHDFTGHTEQRGIYIYAPTVNRRHRDVIINKEHVILLGMLWFLVFILLINYS